MGPLAIVAIVVIAVVIVAVLLVRRRPTASPAAPATPAAPAAAPRTATPRTEGLAARVRAAIGGDPGEDAWARLEDVLVRADVGPAGSADLVERVRARFRAGADPAELIREEILSVLGPDEPLSLPRRDGSPSSWWSASTAPGRRRRSASWPACSPAMASGVSLAASDTFRAAAGEQLDVWAGRAGAHLVAQDRASDPGAVTFDAVTSATARGSDVLIVDTAGRLHTKQPLMDELSKVKRVVAKAGGTVDETLLVVDAQTGQNGIAQARSFTDAVGVTGVVLTKMDGTAKGGIVLAVREELGVPVRFVGTGEALGDLQAFDADAFARRLLS